MPFSCFVFSFLSFRKKKKKKEKTRRKKEKWKKEKVTFVEESLQNHQGTWEGCRKCFSESRERYINWVLWYELNSEISAVNSLLRKFRLFTFM